MRKLTISLLVGLCLATVGAGAVGGATVALAAGQVQVYQGTGQWLGVTWGQDGGCEVGPSGLACWAGDRD